MTALSTLLVESNRAHLSARAIARLARERGHTINHDTAARYLRGDHGAPDETTLRAFADVLDVPLRELRIAADLPSEITTPYVPPAEASRLTRRQRRALDEIIRAMLEPTSTSAKPEKGASEATVTALPVPPREDAAEAAFAADDEAARRGSTEPAPEP